MSSLILKKYYKTKKYYYKLRLFLPFGQADLTTSTSLQPICSI